MHFRFNRWTVCGHDMRGAALLPKFVITLLLDTYQILPTTVWYSYRLPKKAVWYEDHLFCSRASSKKRAALRLGLFFRMGKCQPCFSHCSLPRK